MRKIKFRARSVKTGEFIHGTGITDFLNIEKSWRSGDTCWLWSDYGWHPVDPETVGIFSGINDKNNEEIYENDFIEEGQVFYSQEYLGFFVKDLQGRKGDQPLYDIPIPEVIGNIHQNPELLIPTKEE